MMRSLFSGVSGLKTHQTKMDVIGNNISNVNTVGFKSQSVTFQELLYETTQSASGPNADTGRGGTNAKQIGLGVTNGAISTAITTQGASQTTGNPFDIRISGKNFFIVNDGSSNFFTRAGAFTVDSAGNLVMTTNGYKVMGWQPDVTDPTIIRQDTVSPIRITTAENLTVPPSPTTYAMASGIIDKDNKTLNSADGAMYNLNFYDNLGYAYIAKFKLEIVNKDTGDYSISIADILDSNGDSIVPDDGTTTINDLVSLYGQENENADGTTSPGTELGNRAALKYVPGEGTFVSVGGTHQEIDATGNPETVNNITIRLQFNPGFTYPPGDNGESADLSHFSNVDIDFSTTNNFSNNGTSTFGMDAGDSEGRFAGKMMGNMTGVSITTSGMIYGTYDNGDKKLLGQIATASFSNAAGLAKIGENLYEETLNSGVFDGIGVDVTADGGSMSTGVLEMSNVDLSTEFTEMITTQRGFQANSRIITTSDSMLEELVNLKR